MWKLTSLKMGYCWFLSDYFLAQYFRCTFPRLESFDFDGSPASGVGMQHVFRQCVGMRRMTLNTWVPQAAENQLFLSEVFGNTQASLREVVLTDSSSVTAAMLEPLVGLRVIESLQMRNLPAVKFLRLCAVLLHCSPTLKKLSVSRIAVEKKRTTIKGVPPNSYCAVESLQIGPHLDSLNDKHVADTLAQFFCMVDTFALSGSQITGVGLGALLTSWPRLRALSLDASVVYPLSTILNERFRAPLEHLTLDYRLSNLFANNFLDNIL